MHQPLVVPLDLSVNGADYTTAAPAFEYIAAAGVSAISPNHGPLTGGTTVRVDGLAPARHQSVRCRFGAAPDGLLRQTPSVFARPTLDARALTCSTPAVDTPGTMVLLIALDDDEVPLLVLPPAPLLPPPFFALARAVSPPLPLPARVSHVLPANRVRARAPSVCEHGSRV